ncbi:MAG TPA: Lrp/AsnC family transcriptional regulator [Haliangiales bacterium]|nr:Lrp/AsnC family transcriptional regulator [Haliangiales bacterium]
MALDRIDFEILSALQNDARLANKELAARIGMAPSSCLERVRTLTRAGVLRGSHADVDAAALGIGLEALVAIRLVKHSREAFRSLYATMLAMPEVLTVFHVSGVNDLLVHIAVRDIHHARDLIVERFATRTEVDHCETSVIFDMHRNHQLPCYQQPAGAKPSVAARKRRR